METVYLVRTVDVEAQASDFLTLNVYSDLPGDEMAVRETRTIVASGASRRVYRFRLGGTTKGRLFQWEITGSALLYLFTVKVYAKPLGGAGDWAWHVIPVEPTPEEFTAVPLPIEPTPEEWSATPLPIEATPEEWSAVPLPIEPTPEEFSVAPLPIEKTPDDFTAAPLPIEPTPEEWSAVPLPIEPTPEDWSTVPIPIETTPDERRWQTIPVAP